MSAQRITGSLAMLASPSAFASHAGLLAFAPFLGSPFASAQGSAAATPSQLEEVIANVQAQALGSGTVSDLALPEDLLRRLSDRILRRSFEDNFRIVVDTSAAAHVAAAEVAGRSAGATADATPDTGERGAFRTVLDVLAIGALAVLAFLGYFAWKARARRRE